MPQDPIVHLYLGTGSILVTNFHHSMSHHISSYDFTSSILVAKNAGNYNKKLNNFVSE